MAARSSLPRPGPLAVGGALLLGVVAAGIWTAAGSQLGFDYDAYRAAALRLLQGLPLYDLGADRVGPAGLFLYPPPVAIAVVPFALLAEPLATYLWCAAMVVVVIAAIALMPVPARTREIVLVAAALHWPTQQAIKLGQVEPIVLLLFVVAWRSLDRPRRFGLAAGLGTLVKLRPAILLAWALASRRAGAVRAGLAAIIVVGVATTALAGPDAWLDYPRLLARVGDATETPYAMTAGAIAFRLGAAPEVARTVQFAYLVAVAGLLVATLRLSTDEAGFMAAVVGSQALSPVIWDHYAIVLLAPVAFLLVRGATWAVALLAATPIFLVGVLPSVVYPALFLVTLAAIPFVDRRRPAPAPAPVAG